MSDTPQVGDRIGNYRLDQLVGLGGMAMVFAAHDLVLDRRAALKVIDPRVAGDQRFRDRFLRESRLAARIEHPHIVPIYNAGVEDGMSYIAMRYIEGLDFETLLESPGRAMVPLEHDLMLSVLEPVAEALDSAHVQGLIHRDVKPANILLEERTGRGYGVYLSDFGIAKAMEGTRYTVDGDVLGTPSYTAPEQAKGEAVDSRTDVYALGCVLYRCLSGSPPYVRDNPLAVLAAHYLEPAPVLSDTLPRLRRLDPVLSRALAKDREERQQSCTELLTEVRSALETTDLPETHVVPGPPPLPRAKTASEASPAPASPPSEAPPYVGTPEPAHERDRPSSTGGGAHRYLYLAAALVALAVIGFVGGRLLISDDDSGGGGGGGGPVQPPRTEEDVSTSEPPVALGPPTDATISAQGDDVTISWTDNTDGQFEHVLRTDEGGFVVDDDDTAVEVPPGTETVTLPRAQVFPGDPAEQCVQVGVLGGAGDFTGFSEPACL